MIFGERNKSKHVLRVYQFLQFHAVKPTARSGHDRLSGKRNSIFLQLLLIPNGFFFPGPRFSGQLIVEV